MAGGYEICCYRPEFTPQILELLKYLWGGEGNWRQTYFNWKYVENPFVDEVLGIVALHNGRVVGFRGYFATKWGISGTSKTSIILSPGDTCIDPDHRRQGLSVVMGKWAAQEYATRYKLFLNLSATKVSVPGYLKLGFYPLVTKKHLSKHTLTGLIKYVLMPKKRLAMRESRIAFGDFGKISVRDSPRAEDMQNVVMAQGQVPSKFTGIRDEKFFEWRFKNRNQKYVFYYYRNSDVITAYVVLNLSANNRRGYIVDYAGENTTALETIVDWIIKVKHFDILSGYAFGMDNNMTVMLERKGFSTASHVGRIEKYLHSECPILLRPTDHKLEEKDWFIDDIDLRIFKNWVIKPIYSDAV